MPDEFATLGLTKRERDIVGLAIEGKTDKEIAAVLLIGTETVKSLWERLRAKLAAKNRSHAIAILFSRAQQTLVTEAYRARTLLDSKLLAVVTLDLNARMIDANDAFLELSGYSRSELSSLTCFDLIPPYQHTSARESFQELKVHGRIEPVRKDCLLKNGKRVPVLLGGVRLEDEDDRAICYVIRLPKSMYMGED